MEHRQSNGLKYLLAATIGAFVGGVFVLLATRAIPRAMMGMMSGRMSTMMEQMAQEGCVPPEF